MALLLKKSLNLSNSSLILRALMYVASLQTLIIIIIIKTKMIKDRQEEENKWEETKETKEIKAR
jgi:hypothetical protein